MVWALYGLNSAGSVFRNHLADCMHHLGPLKCPADLYLWMKPIVRPGYGFEYYSYVLIYMDNVMVIHHDADIVICRIDNHFKLKPSLIGNTAIYLGAKLKKMRLENKVWAWANIPEMYVKELVANMGNYLAELADERWQFLKNKAENPFIGGYAP